jgi:PPOX class probable F420-dependent enzyme
VRLSTDECRARLGAADHGVLCTMHAGGGVDAVPVCFAVVRSAEGVVIATPVDRVKAKVTTELGRIANLERDAGATLLCEHWDRDDWSRLWWVRARLRWRPDAQVASPLLAACEAELRRRYRQYEGTEFARVLVFDVGQLSGWAAGPASSGSPGG